jgi:uroporphyrinogen decarboxylase
VTSHPLQAGRALASLRVPQPADGRLPLVLSATRRLRRAHPDLALYGLITGPFTLALHLLGTDIFMQMFDREEQVRALMAFAGDVSQAMARYYREAGCDVIAVVDPMTSQIGPDQFRQFVTPVMAPLFAAIRQQGAASSFFVCGHAQQNIEVMCDCRPDNVSVDENIPLDYVRDQCLKRHISFGGNLQLTTVLLLGKPQDAQQNALACLDIGGERGYVLAPGCDLPYATPPENLEAVARLVHDPYERDVARTLVQAGPAECALDLREYGQSDKVIVDVITLDSEGCAPCQYMVEAVKAVTPHFEGIVEWREHKIKYREALVFMTALMVKNIPTICIDGQITFVSRIPARDELIQAIQKRIFAKLRLKIRQKRVTLYLLGDPATPACQEAHAEAERAVTELGEDVDIRAVTDKAEIMSFGVLPEQTPAIVVGRYQLKAVGRLPDRAIIKEWLKDS